MSGTTPHATAARAAEQAARASYGKLVAILSAQDRDIAAAEDALSDALVAALRMWPVQGVPNNPDAWLLTVARNRRKNDARAAHVRQLAEPEILRQLDRTSDDDPFLDSRLRLLFVCAHPAIDPAARAPLMLQTVLGIDAATIARAFLVATPAMSQRLVRAKARIRDAGLTFRMPETADMPDRLDAVLDAIYTAFSAGWDGMDAPDALDGLTGEAIWLARLIVSLLPGAPEPMGLLALLLYCTARHRARRDEAGRFVPLDQQDARLWNRAMVIEAEGLVTRAAQAGRFGRFQCEAAIQSVHVQRAVTGRLHVVALRTLYDMLVTHTGGIGARIGRAVVMAESGDCDGALAELDALAPERVMTHQPWWVARARVAALAGDTARHAHHLRRAIELTDDVSVRAFLEGQHERLTR